MITREQRIDALFDTIRNTGLTIAAAADCVGVKRGTAARWVMKAGGVDAVRSGSANAARVRRGARFGDCQETDHRRQVLFDCIRLGLTISGAAEHAGVPPGTAAKWVQSAGGVRAVKGHRQ